VIPPCFSFPICTGASSIRRILNPKRTANSWSLWFRIQFWFWAFALHVRHGKYLLFFFSFLLRRTGKHYLIPQALATLYSSGFLSPFLLPLFIISPLAFIFSATCRFERAWDPVIVPGSRKQISYYFLKAVRKLLNFCWSLVQDFFKKNLKIDPSYFYLQFENWLDFDTNPLYALLHESIYCQVDLLNPLLAVTFHCRKILLYFCMMIVEESQWWNKSCNVKSTNS